MSPRHIYNILTGSNILTGNCLFQSRSSSSATIGANRDDGDIEEEEPAMPQQRIGIFYVQLLYYSILLKARHDN